MTTTDVLWNEKAVQVELWVKTHKKLPKRSRTVDAEQNRLGRWLEDNERAITKNTGHNLVTPARIKRIASIKKLTAPKKRATDSRERVHLLSQKERWNLTAHALAAFQEEYGRNPQRKSGDIEEDKLAAWRMCQKYSSEERQQKLDKIAPGWRGSKRNREINTTDDWKAVANEYVAFVKEHNHVPNSPTAKHQVLPNEGRLYFWLNQQRFFLNKGNLAAERKAILDATIPDWSAALARNSEKWDTQFTFVKAFYAEHGRFPTPDRDKNNLQAKKAGVWLNKQRQLFKEYDALNDGVKERLDKLRAYLIGL